MPKKWHFFTQSVYNHQEPVYNHQEPVYNHQELLTLEIEDEWIYDITLIPQTIMTPTTLTQTTQNQRTPTSNPTTSTTLNLNTLKDFTLTLTMTSTLTVIKSSKLWCQGSFALLRWFWKASVTTDCAPWTQGSGIGEPIFRLTGSKWKMLKQLLHIFILYVVGGGQSTG